MLLSQAHRKQQRQALRQARNNLSENVQQAASQALIQQYSTLIERLKLTPHRVALYMSNDGEISPQLLCNQLWSQGISTYLPILDNQALRFNLYNQDSQWQDNRFGIPEPVNGHVLAGQELDIVFMPLVGFDRQGGRLGMGGGFYDRTFEGKNPTQPPLLIGLAHDCQEVDNLSIESWDIPLNGILTPTQIVLTDR
ncbi:5-formyltetrahydrofolate cyclo-ligase [Marinomonas sp.]